MINAWHLIWIIPLSMITGVATFIFLISVVVGKMAEEEEERLRQTTEECRL